jgi:hypothetical protein
VKIAGELLLSPASCAIETGLALARLFGRAPIAYACGPEASSLSTLCSIGVLCGVSKGAFEGGGGFRWAQSTLPSVSELKAYCESGTLLPEYV